MEQLLLRQIWANGCVPGHAAVSGRVKGTVRLGSARKFSGVGEEKLGYLRP